MTRHELTEHDKGSKRATFYDKGEPPVVDARDTGGDGPVINPQAAPAALGSAYTVTAPNPTPPTNIPYVAYSTPPLYTMAPAVNPRDPTWVPGAAYTTAMKPTYTDDAVLILAGGLVPVEGKTPTAGQVAPQSPGSLIPSTAVSTVATATPVAGGSGPAAEGTPIVVVTQPLAGASQAASAFPQQIISVQGSFTATPNASHASSAPHMTSLEPQNSAAGASPTTIPLAVNGNGFNVGSVVNVGGVAQTTVFVSPSRLTVAAAPRRSTAGSSTVNVTTDAVVGPSIPWVFV
jgi:hypothetical protein